MKRQVLLGLTLMLICFLIGGVYIISAIRGATGQLENAVTMHYIDDLSNELQYNIKLVQTNLLLLDSPHAKSPETMQTNLDRLRELIGRTVHPHRDEKTRRQIAPIHGKAGDYVDRVAAILQKDDGANAPAGEKTAALRLGQQLLEEITALSRETGANLSHRSETIYRDITRVSHLITFLVIVGPITILLITAFFLKRFTGSIRVLAEATETLGQGELDYRIDADLKYEFKQLADSFNSMSDALQRQRDELQSVQQLYQALFNCAGDGIFILDLTEGQEGQIISANPAAAVMHGFRVDELLQMNVADLCVGGMCPERMQCALAGTWDQYEVDRLRKDGTVFLAEVSLGLLEMKEKKYAILFSRDITQRKREEEELQRAHHLAVVGEMAAGLAHEIKNPLAGIKVSLEVLADELDLSEEDADLFVRVINETTRVEKLLKGLLNYARPPKLHIESFDLNQLLDNSIKNLFPPGKSSGYENIGFARDYQEALPALQADSAQLQQVILNILLNALEAMPEGGTIGIGTALEDTGQVRIWIRDQGKGLTEESCKEIFQPFYTTKTKGTGLGLAICKRIIEQHHGTIQALPGPERGAEFHIVLPLEQPAAEHSQTNFRITAVSGTGSAE